MIRHATDAADATDATDAHFDIDTRAQPGYKRQL